MRAWQQQAYLVPAFLADHLHAWQKQVWQTMRAWQQQANLVGLPRERSESPRAGRVHNPPSG
eukprot:1512926-Heterocapsa_arctica.AAC.1